MPSVGRINGDILAIKVNGQIIAVSKDISQSIAVAQRETTSRDDSGRYQGEPTKITETMKGSQLVAFDNNSYQTIKSLARSRSKFTVTFGSTISGDPYDQCTGFFTSLDTSAPDNDNVAASFGIQITGTPVTLTNP